MVLIKINQYQNSTTLKTIVDEIELRGESHGIIYCTSDYDIKRMREDMLKNKNIGVIKSQGKELFIVGKFRIELIIPDVSIGLN